MERVRVYNQQGMPSRQSVGIFARAFMRQFPLVPVEEEGRLSDPLLRVNFIERVFSYRRFQDLLVEGVTRKAVVRFHTIHTYLLLAHSAQGYQSLARLVGRCNRYRPKDLALRYGQLFMKALTFIATARKHVKVLQHIVGYFKAQLSVEAKDELLSVIEDYHKGLTPLIAPLTLVKHYVQLFDVDNIRDQVYLNPHPQELMLRNHAEVLACRR